MKKALLTVLAVFTIFAMTLVGCDTSADGDEITIKFDLNDGPGTTPGSIKITKETALKASEIPTLAGGEKDGFNWVFNGWYTATTDGTKVDINYKFTDGTTITVYAQWTKTPVGGAKIKAGKLGEYTAFGGAADNQKGWDNIVWDKLKTAKYIVIEAQAEENKWGLGGLDFVIQGDGILDADGKDKWIQYDMWGSWLSNEDTGLDQSKLYYIVIQLDKLDDWADFIEGTRGKIILAHFSNPIEDDYGLKATYLVLDDINLPDDAEPAEIKYGFVITDIEFDFALENVMGTGTGGGGDLDLEGAEEVSLANANQVVYSFTLPAGATWEDYKGIAASYMFEDDAMFDVSNSGRAIRIYGPYELAFFQFNETTAGNKYAYASLAGNENNNAYILDGNPNGGWKPLRESLEGIFGECPAGGEWFTIDYKIDGSRKDGAYAHMPADDATGPFYFGLGLPGADDANVFYMRDVTLLGYIEADNVIGKPLYISKDGYNYPAFSAYGTAADNGVDQISREMVDGTQPTPVAWIDWTGIEQVSLANANQVVYNFVLPEGATWEDYKGITAEYMLEDDAMFEVENSGRAIRIYGPYELDFFQFNETDAGNKYAYASMDGSANNNAYILDGNPNGGWKSLNEALTGIFGECPAGGEWFTIDYKIDGSRKDGAYAHMPADDATGPFYFGLGLPGQGDANVFYMKNVTLVGYDEADNVIGKPLYISKDSYDYPAFSAYGTAADNGVDQISRKMMDFSAPTVVPAPTGPAPDEPLVLEGDEISFATYGGLGAFNADAGPGPFLYSTTYAYDAFVYFKTPEDAADYDTMTVEFTLEIKDDSGSPAKLNIKGNIPADAGGSWNGATFSAATSGMTGVNDNGYVDITEDGDYTFTVNMSAVGTGWGIQQNSRTSGSCNYELTFTKITFE